MADNITVTPGTGTTIAADDVGGVLVQRVKATWGVDGTATDVSAASPLPVSLATTPGLTDTQLRASAVPVSFTVSAATYTDRSGTITTGGTAQTLMASNSSRKGWRVMNLSTADLWINDRGATAAATQPAFKLAAGAMYESPSWGASSAEISIFGATTGQAFSAVEA